MGCFTVKIRHTGHSVDSGESNVNIQCLRIYVMSPREPYVDWGHEKLLENILIEIGFVNISKMFGHDSYVVNIATKIWRDMHSSIKIAPYT